MFVSLKEAGGIYFITFPGSSDFVKIGKSVCFSKRFSQLQTASPHPLSVELIFPASCLSDEALSITEQEFHFKFASHRYRGEWFVKSGKLEEFIDLRHKLYPESKWVYTNDLSSEVWGWDYSDVDKAQIQIKGYDFPTLLSNRELECAVYVSKGCSNNEISALMDVGSETIKTYICNCLKKLRLANRTQLAVEVVRRGWDQEDPQLSSSNSSSS